MATGSAADVEAMGDVRFKGAAAGPAPWPKLAALVAAAIALSAAADAAGDLALAMVAMAAIAAFWMVLPRGPSTPPLPRWIAIPMIAWFVAMLFVPVLLGTFDRDLIGVGYAVGFILWLQVGLWLAEAFRPATAGATAGKQGPPGPTTAQRAGAVAVVVVASVLFSALAYGLAEERDGGVDGSAPTTAVATTSHGHYPPASSTAGPMSPDWMEYAAAIDRACALNYNSTLTAQAGVELSAKQESWDRAETIATIQRLWAGNQRALVADVKALGEPPAKGRLLDRWLRNVEHRGKLFAFMAASNRRGDPKSARAAWKRISRLKDEANRLGRDYGLRICTSN